MAEGDDPVIAHLCDHRIRLYRPVEGRDQWGDAVLTWVEQSVPAGLNARPDQAWSGDLQNPGAGQVQSARRRWFLRSDVGAEERDVFRVVEGPEVGAVLRIVSVTRTTDPLTVHHMEVNVEPTTTDVVLPSDGGS